MLEQYRRLKAEHPGTLLLFRMGDFYETFGEDALVASRVLASPHLPRQEARIRCPLPRSYHAVEGT